MSSMRNGDGGTLSSVGNALRVVELVAQAQSIRVMEVAERLGVARSTAHRLLATLMERGFVVQDSHKVYHAGPALVRMRTPPHGKQITEVLRPHLDLLVEETGETCHIAVLEGTGSRYVLGAVGRNDSRRAFRVGLLFPAYRTAGGRALLAELRPPALASLFPRGLFGEERDPRGAQASLLDLDRQMRVIRKAGYATNDRSRRSPVSSFGVSLYDANGRAIAGLSLAVEAPRFREPAVSAYVERMRQTAVAVHEELVDMQGLRRTGSLA